MAQIMLLGRQRSEPEESSLPQKDYILAPYLWLILYMQPLAEIKMAQTIFYMSPSA